MDSILKIKNTIAFLGDTSPEALNDLKKKFPADKDLLSGRETYGAEDNADSPEKRKAVLMVTLKALSVVMDVASPLQNTLRRKLAAAKRLRFIASVLTILSSTVIVVLIGTEKGSFGVKLGLAVFNFITAILPQIADWLGSSKYGDKKSLQESLTELNSLTAEGKSLMRMLQKDMDLDNYDNDTVANVKKTDELLGKLTDVSESLK